MKYIFFWEFCPENLGKVIEKTKKHNEKMAKNPEKYATTLYPSHSLGGQTKGFAIVEATPEQCRKTIMHYLPELKGKFMPIFEAGKLIEEYKK